MYIERLLVKSFRQIRDGEFGPFREPAQLGELIILAGPNGGGKTSVLELLSYGLATRYSWGYWQSRNLTEQSFAIKVGLTGQELEYFREHSQTDDAAAYAVREQGYWLQTNMADVAEANELALSERVHAIVSQRFQSFSQKLGFFVRSDRSYTAKAYDRNVLFNWRTRLQPQWFTNISYQQTSQQYSDMYDFLAEQSYYYVYQLGEYLRNSKQGIQGTESLDHIKPYNELLGQLFSGYAFEDIRSDDLSLRVKLPSGNSIPFPDLSSGEKEVFFILSFFLRHDINNSIIIIDEPELHLHPELSRKLIRLMRTIRTGNQIWAATHSPDLVDEAGREHTFFIRANEDRTRSECIPATAEGAEIQILRDLFGYSGYVGLSRKIVFSEGEDSSADRKTFTNLFPDLTREVKLIPAGSVDNLYRINRAILALLESDVARTEFYLVRDRDYLSDEAVKKHLGSIPGKLFVLTRYHIENYLLDEYAIADVMKSVYQRSTTAHDVRHGLSEIATANSAGFLRDLVAFRFAELYQREDCTVGNHSSGLSVVGSNGAIRSEVVDPLKDVMFTKMLGITTDIAQRTSTANLESIFEACLAEVRAALAGDGWRSLLPGRYLLRRCSADHKLGEWPALQNLLIERLGTGDYAVNAELKGIFEQISQ
jgi:ABC-type multidrug transport system ATPase subunit